MGGPDASFCKTKVKRIKGESKKTNQRLRLLTLALYPFYFYFCPLPFAFLLALNSFSPPDCPRRLLAGKAAGVDGVFDLGRAALEPTS